MAFILVEGGQKAHMNYNDDLLPIQELAEKEKIKNNPFSNIPQTSLEKAFLLLEEYSEELTEP